MASLTEKERDVMRHALGLRKPTGGRRYRNYYVADADGPDAAVWRPLVARGLATERPFIHAPNSVIFHATEAGIALAEKDPQP